jgi:hypothetical protein
MINNRFCVGVIHKDDLYAHTIGRMMERQHAETDNEVEVAVKEIKERHGGSGHTLRVHDYLLFGGGIRDEVL